MKLNIAHLVHRFLEGNASPEEAHTLFELINSDKYKQEINEAIDHYTLEKEHELNSKPTTSEELVTFDRLFEQITEANKKVVPIENSDSGRSHWWAWAAAFIAIIIMGAFFTINRTTFFQTDTTAEVADEINEFTGKRHVQLPDGSTVVMNEGSKLTYRNSYGEALREVWLTGEAYFKVKPDKQHAFVVRTHGNVTTEVLGTEFNVSAWPENKQVVVTVTKGRVQVFADEVKKAPEVLTPDQQISVNTESREYNKQELNAQAVVAWKDKFLIMDDVSFEEAAKVINERYKTQVVFERGELKACRFTATFLEDETLTEVLMVLNTITNTQSAILDDGTVKISGAGCKQK